MNKYFLALVVLSVATIIPSCSFLQNVFENQSPREKYAMALDQSNLRTSAMVKQWIEEGNQALNNSLILELPTTLTGYFESANPEALAFKSYVKRGQLLQLNATIQSKQDTKLFIDLMSRKNDQGWKCIAFADSTYQINFEVVKNDTLLIRIQPELLAEMHYSISFKTSPALKNPVLGASNKDIGSFYGDSRDAGKRQHEGIDIFAPKGTPVIAPATGLVSRVGENGLGGKIIWLRDKGRNQSYYFAHLDSQKVFAGKKVHIGDTLGFVGNTGNAKFTPPHLHFGIYAYSSIDPLAFVWEATLNLKSQPADTARMTIFEKRIKPELVNLRSGPSTQSKIIGTLPKKEHLKLLANVDDWYLVKTQDKLSGFIAKRLTEALSPIASRHAAQQTIIYFHPKTDSTPKTTLHENEPFTVLARHQNFSLISADNVSGWVSID